MVLFFVFGVGIIIANSPCSIMPDFSLVVKNGKALSASVMTGSSNSVRASMPNMVLCSGSSPMRTLSLSVF